MSWSIAISRLPILLKKNLIYISIDKVSIYCLFGMCTTARLITNIKTKQMIIRKKNLPKTRLSESEIIHKKVNRKYVISCTMRMFIEFLICSVCRGSAGGGGVNTSLFSQQIACRPLVRIERRTVATE